ncbi:MAG TPA: FeoB-associated Cys-rich membrane protein [Bacteroidales bacterium]|nr:FeoB-associated Cys-rich membrane protein [Bacteroidales bacterium]
MIQDILTYCAITWAVGWSIWRLYRTLKPAKTDGCSGGCSSCELKNELRKKTKTSNRH